MIKLSISCEVLLCNQEISNDINREQFRFRSPFLEKEGADGKGGGGYKGF